MPDSFKKFPSTGVILNATEFKVQSPSSLLRQSQVFSQCKSTTTAKALVGIAPSGSVTFVSQLYTGGISDEITKQSKVLTLLERGDNVMAAKGLCDRGSPATPLDALLTSLHSLTTKDSFLRIKLSRLKKLQLLASTLRGQSAESSHLRSFRMYFPLVKLDY